MLVFSCGEGTIQDDTFSATEERTACDLLSEDLLRTSLHIDRTVFIMGGQGGNVCAYSWVMGKTTHEVSLRLSPSSMDEEALNQAWEHQNRTVYKQFDTQGVSGVGEKATWSDLGGGELRVMCKGEIFYINYGVRSDTELSVSEKIANAGIVARAVCEKI